MEVITGQAPDPPKVLCERRLAFGDVQVLEWRWPSPMDITVREQRHMIEMALPPLATEGRAAFPELAPDRFLDMGSVFLRPAGVAIRSLSAGGVTQIVRLAVEPEAYATIANRDLPLDERALRAGLDLRDGLVRAMLERLRTELNNPGFANQALLEAYGTALVIETARSIGGEGEPLTEGPRLAAWQQRRVRDRLAAEGPPPGVAELAALCGVGVRHFTRLYRGVTGEAVTVTIARQQIARASRMLAETDAPLKQIAAELGFTAPGGFAAAFRRATGASPSRYRQQHRRRAAALLSST